MHEKCSYVLVHSQNTLSQVWGHSVLFSFQIHVNDLIILAWNHKLRCLEGLRSNIKEVKSVMGKMTNSN